MKFCDFNEKHSLSRCLLPPGKIKNCNWEVFFLLKNISTKLQKGGNHLSTYTNNCCSSYTRALVQSSVSGKLAQLVETNSTVLISYATSMSLHSAIQMPENAHNHHSPPSSSSHRSPRVALCFRRSLLGLKSHFIKTPHSPHTKSSRQLSPKGLRTS